MSERLFDHSIVCGKFYPPHMGHHYLIDTAVHRSKKVTVIVCWRSDETISKELRMKCLQEKHPKAKVIAVPCIPDDDDSVGWGKYTIAFLGESPDAVFSSESYGKPYANSMGATHVMVDQDRKLMPISGTMIRENPLKYFDYLSPMMKAYYVPRIVIVGAESTGTTTLAKALAKHYNTVCVPEFGRTYAEWKYGKGDRVWYPMEFIHIGMEQNRLEDMYARNANKVLICDTDSFATELWSERYCDSIPYPLKTIADYRNKFYIITNVDIPFVQDEKGTRDGEDIRFKMHGDFCSMMISYKREFMVASGSLDDRVKSSVEFIDGILKDYVKIDKKECDRFPDNFGSYSRERSMRNEK